MQSNSAHPQKRRAPCIPRDTQNLPPFTSAFQHQEALFVYDRPHRIRGTKGNNAPNFYFKNQSHPMLCKLRSLRNARHASYKSCSFSQQGEDSPPFQLVKAFIYSCDAAMWLMNELWCVELLEAATYRG
jgi:hypothetical protein